MIRVIAFIVFGFLPSFAAADRSVLSAVNTLRADAGQGALVYSTHLETLAQTHADDMSSKGFFSHTGSDGSQLGDRARRVGYGFCFVAENIAKGQRSASEALQGWIESRGHLRNMLDHRATELGMAQAPGAIWVMVLGRPGC